MTLSAEPELWEAITGNILDGFVIVCASLYSEALLRTLSKMDLLTYLQSILYSANQTGRQTTECIPPPITLYQHGAFCFWRVAGVCAC